MNVSWISVLILVLLMTELRFDLDERPVAKNPDWDLWDNTEWSELKPVAEEMSDRSVMTLWAGNWDKYLLPGQTHG